MKKSKSKKKKVVIAVSGMILAVSIGAVGFKYKNAIENDNILQNVAYSSNQDDVNLMSESPEQIDILENKLWQIKINDRDNFVILSDGFITLENYNTSKHAYEGSIKKYDFDGNLIFDLRDKITPIMEEITSAGIHKETEPEVWAIRENPNNNNLLVFFRGTEYADSFWLEFDKYGNYIRIIEDTADTYLGHMPYISKCFNDGFLVAYYNTKIKKIDYDGNLVWSDSLLPGTTFGILKDGDNYVILNYDNNVGGSISNIYLVILNSLGEVISNKTLLEDRESMYYNPVATSYDDGFIIKFNERDEFGEYKLRIVKVDLEGNIIWDKTEEETYNAYTGSMITLSNCLSNGFAIMSDPEELIIKRYDTNGNLVEDRACITSGELSIPPYSEYVFLVEDKILFAYYDSSYYYFTAVKSSYLDSSKLDEILEEVGKLEESDYSDETWQDLQDAITGTDDLTSQEEIDAKVDEIQEAIDNLDVDRSELDKILEEVAGLNEADYSNSSWDALQDAITGTDNLTKQSEIDSKVQEIQNALNNLGIDRSVLDALLENVSKLNPSDYSDESWNALQQAITGTDNLTKQSEIDAKVEEIKNAVDRLGIDRSALDAILAEVEKLVETDYSKASWDVLENAVNMSDTVTTQSQVDNAVEQIRNAMDGLTIDRSQLDRLLEEVKKLNSSDYSNSSWNALQQAITGTDNLTKQSEIDSKVQEIQNALNNLGIDRSVLDALLENVSKLNPSDYSDESWNALQQAITGTDNLTKQSEIDSKVQEIQNALNNLGIDRSVLDRLLEEIRNLKERDYSVESWTNLQNVVKGSDTLTKQDEVNKKVDDLQKALAALTVDRTKLDEIIKKVESMDSTKYTTDSWQALEGLLDVDELTKQYEIDDRVEDIEKAINNLILDMSKLEDLIDQSENLNKDDYTEDSWNNLDQTVTDIKDKINNGEINEDNIDDYVTKLQDALNSLQKNEDKNATDDQNVNTSDIMGMGLILTFIVSVLGILKNVKKFIFKK